MVVKYQFGIKFITQFRVYAIKARFAFFNHKT